MLKVRLESRVKPSSLTVLERVTKVAATSTRDVTKRRVAQGCAKKDSIRLVRVQC